jgi:hypothetical protein
MFVLVDEGDGEHPHLAPAYQLALDLEAQGLAGEELAERLGVPSEALPSLLQVAHAKAAAHRDAPAGAQPLE